MRQTCSLCVGNWLQAEAGCFYCLFFFFKENPNLFLALQSRCSEALAGCSFTGRLKISWLRCYKHSGQREKWV